MDHDCVWKRVVETLIDDLKDSSEFTIGRMLYEILLKTIAQQQPEPSESTKPKLGYHDVDDYYRDDPEEEPPTKEEIKELNERHPEEIEEKDGLGHTTEWYKGYSQGRSDAEEEGICGTCGRNGRCSGVIERNLTKTSPCMFTPTQWIPIIPKEKEEEEIEEDLSCACCEATSNLTRRGAATRTVGQPSRLS